MIRWNGDDGTLGEGHFGKVYKAMCKSGMCTYAIKVMPIDGVKMEKISHMRATISHEDATGRKPECYQVF